MKFIIFQGKDFGFPNLLEIKKDHHCLSDKVITTMVIRPLDELT